MKTYNSKELGQVTIPDTFKNELSDEENPNYMFSLTATSILTDIANGHIDPVRFAKQELANRGLDENGEWVGFEKAKKIHL